jgi:hypothetical protein
MIRKDILLDENFDLLIQDGDFVIGDCLNQQINCLLQAVPGSYKQHPTIGVDIDSFILDSNSDELNRAIREQFKKDRLSVKSINITNEKINIIAEHEQ